MVLCQLPREDLRMASRGSSSRGRGRNTKSKGSLKQELYAYAVQNMWCQAKSIYDEFPEMVRIPLTAGGDTALHVAVKAKSTNFVEELVNFKHVTPEDLKIPNVDGNTTFCIAAITGHRDVLKTMIKKNEDLLVVPGYDGMLAVHLAVLTGYHEIVQDLSSEELLHKMDFKDIQRLFFMTIKCCMYDVTAKLVQKYPERLIIARDNKENLTALHMLARKPSKEFYMQENKQLEEGSSIQVHQLGLVQKIWALVRQLEHNKILELIIDPSIVLFDAVKSSNIDFVKWLLDTNRELLMIKDLKNEHNLLHFVVLHRQQSIFNFILEMETAELIKREVDKDGNNVLHFSARQLEEPLSIMRPNIQMERELKWFKEVKDRVPLELRNMRNKHGKTPDDIFYAEHKELSEKVKDSATGIATSGMVVAALVAAITFAAALTTPGDKNNAWFPVFILANALALFNSCGSIISFFSFFTSTRFKESDLIILLHPSLFMGLTLLSISMAAMVIAFAAASVLIFDHRYQWVPYLVAYFGLLPVTMSLVLQTRFLDRLLDGFVDEFNCLLGMLAGRIFHLQGQFQSLRDL